MCKNMIQTGKWLQFFLNTPLNCLISKLSVIVIYLFLTSIQINFKDIVVLEMASHLELPGYMQLYFR